MFALILAGGKGERLRPLTDSLPKPMVPVCGKPILEHQVTWLKAGGVTDVVFLGGYRWEAIKDHFGDGKDFGINAHYSVEDSPLGRGGAIKAGFPMIPDTENTVAVLNGDVLTAETLANISAQHQERKDANELRRLKKLKEFQDKRDAAREAEQRRRKYAAQPRQRGRRQGL